MDNEMKLIIAIISNENANKVQTSLNQENIFNTRLTTKGGFLKETNTTFVIGIKKEKVEKVLDIFRKFSKTKTQLIPNNILNEMSVFAPLSSEVTIGGVTVFILDIEQFLKI
ncbi:cyclic-di-AMP receptor [Candidatus Phytoplasma ziziphi]|nr:cyclic-di-AMP receptor [Candidatus Phytoplasma ziziphi]